MPAKRVLTGPELGMLAALRGYGYDPTLGTYIRRLSKDGVQHYKIAEAMGLAESTVSTYACRVAAPLCGQQVPDSLADRLRELQKAGASEQLSDLLAAATEQRWSCAALGAAIGISGQAVHARASRARNRGHRWQKLRATVPTPPGRPRIHNQEQSTRQGASA